MGAEGHACPSRFSRSRTCRSPSSPAPAEIPAVMNFSASVAPGRGARARRRVRAAASRRWRSAVMRDLGKTGRIVGGSIRFKGRELTTMSDAELRQIRGSEIAMIYQEPMASLNPAMKVDRQLMEVPMIHEGASAADARAQALRVVEAVRLPDPEAHPRQLPAPALRRPAAAHRHRHGADVEALAPDPRRADDRARRHRRGRHRRSGEGPRAASSAPRCSSSATTSGWCWRPATASA